MPIDEKKASVSVDVYSMDVSGASVHIGKTASMSGIEASFRYAAGGTFEMLILINVSLQGSVSLVDYPQTLDRVTVVNILRDGEPLNEAIQLGEFMAGRILEDSRRAIGEIGISAGGHMAFIVSSYENDDADGKYVVSKLLPTGVEIGI